MRRRQDPKIKITVYVSRQIADQLSLACKDRTKNKSKLTETALTQLLPPKGNEQQEATVQRRLDKLSREVSLINRHQQIVIESLGIFIRHYLTLSPQIPQADIQAAQAYGHQRFQRFIEQLGKRLAGTQSLVADIAAQLANGTAGESVAVANTSTQSASTSPTKTH